MRGTLVMGVLNITPDSFYDGGRWADAPRAIEHARTLAADGAGVIDAGAESSRPGAEPVGLDEELRRLEPLLERAGDLGAPLSIDTYRAETARRAIEAGAVMVNDITALRGDPDMGAVVAETGVQCILMHMLGRPQTMQDRPRYDDVVEDICGFFGKRIEYALAEGIREDQLWLDPGFGFGKTVEDNLALLRRMREFKRFSLPILIGPSNKSTIGKVLDAGIDERGAGTAATVAASIVNGADAVRVHDVREMARVVRMTDAIIGKGR
jgi:dihydropteroate synthase